MCHSQITISLLSLPVKYEHILLKAFQYHSCYLNGFHLKNIIIEICMTKQRMEVSQSSDVSQSLVMSWYAETWCSVIFYWYFSLGIIKSDNCDPISLFWNLIQLAYSMEEYE